MSQSIQTPESERRQYFRIRNRLFMGYELLDSEQDISDSDSNDAKSLPFSHLLGELNRLIANNDLHIESLSSQQHLTIDHLNQVNSKIEQLTQYMIQSLNLSYSDLQEVDLSGGGIRFTSKREMSLGQKLKIELVLVPEYYYLVVHAKVVDCLPINNSYELADRKSVV